MDLLSIVIAFLLSHNNPFPDATFSVWMEASRTDCTMVALHFPATDKPVVLCINDQLDAEVIEGALLECQEEIEAEI